MDNRTVIVKETSLREELFLKYMTPSPVSLSITTIVSGSPEQSKDRSTNTLLMLQ
jgi:hypothetical protein